MGNAEQLRAAQGDVHTIKNLVGALAAPEYANQRDAFAARRTTLEAVRTWLDAAEEHRPRSNWHEEFRFALSLGTTATYLATIRDRLLRGDGQVSGPHLVIEEQDGRMEFRVPSDIPDAALEALVALGEHGPESLAEPDPRGRAVTVAWNTESQSWERIVHRR
ncbi:hypothetical protein [Streptomyces coeruleorubidus]|uniref:hypothetical protein n=1 Tax=Streptomyces coeruleorubidus TaxID=116188 RepID=UPI003661FEF9